LERIPAGICVTDASETIEWCNRVFSDLLDIDHDSAKGLKINDLPLKRSQDPGNDAALLTPERRPNTAVLYSSAPLDGGGRMVMLTDVSSIHRPSNNIDLGELAGTDLDTGLLTSNVINKQLMSEVSRCRRYGNPLSVVVLRVDSEDSYAPQQMLTAVSVRIADNLRWVDYAGRLDNETLLLILPETDGVAAELLVEKLSPLVDSVEIVTNGDKHSPHCKLAWVEWNDADDAMGLVDRALAQVN